MKISVKNFGPIGEAKDIHLSPMTLFVGPSNTGKSYLAILLYAIAETLQNRFMPSFSYPAAELISDSGAPISEKAKEVVAEQFAKFFAGCTVNLSKMWKRKILYCFGEDGENLISGENMLVTARSDDGAVFLDFMSPDKSKISAAAQAKICESFIQLVEEDFKEYKTPNAELRYGISWINILAEMWKDAPMVAHYLPAIRGGIMQSHRGLVDAAMAQAPFVGLRGHSPRTNTAPMFNGVLSDFMRKLIDLSSDKTRFHPRIIGARPRNKNIALIGERMENEIMDGEIKIHKNETGYPIYRYQFSRGGKERELSLRNSSSMVSELAPISVFVRHHLEEGDLFIVEEPEAHLHPKGQQAISDILVQLANAGVFVLATTHSDIVLEQIGNAVRRAGLENKKSAAKNGGESLNENQAAAYSFHERIRGKTKVKSVKFETVEGFATDDHLKASTALYNETVALWNADES